MSKKKNKKYGYTLVELLGVISVLAIIFTIVIYVALNIISSSKDKSYQITINSIESYADSYLLENSNRLFFVTMGEDINKEYQCITVHDLIETGYFDNSILNSYVSKNRKVSEDDYIYIERNKNNKTILKTKYLIDDVLGCGDAVKANSDISITYTPNDWSLEKEVTIRYKVKNYFNIDDYTYHYEFDGGDVSVVEDDGTTKVLKVINNGNIRGYIKEKNVEIEPDKIVEINGIDREGPIINIETNGLSYVKNIDSKISVVDNGVGGDSATYKYIYSTDIDAIPNNLFTSGSNYKLSGETGVYYLIVSACDKLGNCSKKVSDKLYIDNISPTINIGTDGNSSYVKSIISSISVSDNDSGGDSATYKYIYSTDINASSSSSFASGNSYSLSGKTGIYYLIVNACDKAGNCSKKMSNKFYLDNTGPVIKTSNLTKIYGVSFDLYEGVTITDGNSGVDSKKIYLGGKEINSYSQLSLGSNTVTYKVKDKAGNESSVSRTITLVVADKEFNYLEKDQLYKVEATGTYIIEVYGAQGGNSGGKGGYVKAEIQLAVGQQLVINTGGINGYNGGGGYKVSGYNSGGGASTVKLNGSNIVIAAGGGGKGDADSAGVGGSGNATGGASVGSGAGKNGTNGGGGSSSPNYKYDCSCSKGCYSCTYTRRVQVCAGNKLNNDSLGGTRCWYEDRRTSGANCSKCGSYKYNCNTCTKKGKSGKGGTNKIFSPAVSKETASGIRNGNGYVKISYKVEG